MRVPGAAPPPERLARGPLVIGPHRLSARIAEGRRTTTYVADSGADVVRVVRRAEDLEALRAELGDAEHVEGDGRHAFVQPLVVSESLATVLDLFLEQGRAVPLPIALTVAMGVAGRLETLGRPHLDLVPQHVLLAYDGTVHLIDPAPSGGRGDAPGREGYRAPEHVDGGNLDATTDVFGLGVLLFEMTCGRRLFGPECEDLEQRILQADVPRPRDIVGDGYPIELQLVLRKLMRPSRAGRFPSARAAKDALRLVATTRADVGPGALASWLRTELAGRRAAWNDLLGASADLEGPIPQASRPRAPSRAQTRPSSFLGAGAPTIEELRLDSATIEAVRKRILVEADALSSTDDEAQAALRGELEQMKRRRTELPALGKQNPDATQPSAQRPPVAPRTGRRPIGLDAEDTYEDLEVLTIPPEATAPAEVPPRPRGAPNPAPSRDPAPTKPKGLAASPPPTMVPELPTEVTRRFPPLPQPLGLEPADSDAATSLDELEPVAGPVAEIDMLASMPQALEPVHDDVEAASEPTSRGDEASSAPRTALSALRAADADFTAVSALRAADAGFTAAGSAGAAFGLGDGVEPGSLADLSPEALMAPATDTDRGPAPSELDLPPPTSPPSQELAPALSDDLVLEPFAGLDAAPNPAPLAEETDQGDAPQAAAAAWAAGLAPDDGGDTIQDAQDPLLGPDDLAQLQRAVEIVPERAFSLPPAGHFGAGAPDLETTEEEPPPRSTFVGSEGGASGEAEVAAGRRGDTPRPKPPRSLGAAPPPASQAAISTQVVRDRIVPSRPPVDASHEAAPPPPDMLRAHAPLAPEDDERPLTPTPHLDLGPPRAAAPDDESSTNLVIPISDDELEATERRHRWRGLALLAAVGALVVVAGAGAVRLGALDRLVHPSTEIVPVPERTPAPRPAPARPPPDEAPPVAAEPPPAAAPPPPAEAAPTPSRPRPAGAEAAPRPARARPTPRAEPPAPPEPAPSEVLPWVLTIEALPESATIEIDGREVENMRGIELADREPVTVTVSKEGYQTVSRTVRPSDAGVELHILLRRLP